MSRDLPWYKRDVDAWRGGTRSMSMELRGFYSECLDAMWDLQGPIPKEVEKLAIMLCCNPRTVRKLLPVLIAMGKLIETPDGYVNSRMMAEIGHVGSTPIQSEFASNSASIRAEFDSKVPKNQMFSTREVRRKKEEKEEEAPACVREDVSIEGGRVTIGPSLASEILAEFPHARVIEVEAMTAADLAKTPAMVTRAGVVAIARKCAMLNHRDNSRGHPASRPKRTFSPAFLKAIGMNQ